MATGLTKKQKEALTDKITGLIKNSPALRMTLDSSVNEMNINQISVALNRIHYQAIGKDLPTTISFAPKQLGSGDPSPDNIRPIVGYEIDGIGTVYGGELNIETGVLTVLHGHTTFGELTWLYVTAWEAPAFRATGQPEGMKTASVLICDSYRVVGPFTTWESVPRAGDNVVGNVETLIGIVCRDDRYNISTDFVASAVNVVLIYELATPVTYPLTPQQMLQLLDQL